MMARLYMIRHGEPETAWGAAAGDDPGLSATGREQAEAAAQVLAALGRLMIVSSPMRRCRETAAPFEARAGQTALIEPRVSEVAAPAGVADRRSWLSENFPWDGVARRRWSSLDPALRAWRDSVVAAVLELRQDAAVFSHFIAINAVAGAATGSDDTIVCAPNYGSITEFEVRGGKLDLIRFGQSMTRGEVR